MKSLELFFSPGTPESSLQIIFLPMQVSEQIIAARKEKGITQEELAEKANLTTRTIQRIESGDTIPRPYTIKAIAHALGLPFESFQSGEPDLREAAADHSQTTYSLQLLALSCFSYLLIPFVHFMIPMALLRKQKHLPSAAIAFGRKLVRSQLSWLIGMIIGFLIVLAWNLLIGKKEPALRVHYLYPFFISYFVNAIVIGVFLFRIKRWQLEPQ